jgi:hypothetical protein
MRPALATLALALLLLPGAGAHGGSAQVQKPMGPYLVTFYGYDYVTVQEDIRVAWSIADAALNAPVEAGNATVDLTIEDAQGKVVKQEQRHPTQSARGFVYMDTQSGPRGRVLYDVRLGAHNVTFEQVVCDIDAQGQMACGPLTADKKSPLPLAAPLLAAVMAAMALSRRRP